MYTQIHKLQAENLQLRQPAGPAPPPALPSERAEHTLMGPGGSTHRRDRQAFSMYEPGSALKPFGGAPADELATRLQPFHSTVSSLLALAGEMREGHTNSKRVTLFCLPQELEDDAIYSVHASTGLYRVSRTWGRTVNPAPVSHEPQWPQQAMLGQTLHCRWRLTLALPWLSDPEGGVCLLCALHSLLPTAVMLPRRKSPHGNLHPSTQGQCVGCYTGPGMCAHPSPLPTLQSKLSRHGSGADSDYENTQSGDPLLG